MNQLNEQLRTLRLGHAAKGLEQQREQLSTYAELTFEERLSLLVDWHQYGASSFALNGATILAANGTTPFAPNRST